MSSQRISLLLREGTWWVSYVKRGVQWEEPTGTSDRHQAELFARRCLGGYARDTPLESGDGEMSLELARRTLLTDYQINQRRSVARVVVAWKQILAHFGSNCPIKDVSSERLLEYAAARMQKVARGTAAYELRVLRRSLQLLALLGRLDKLPQFPRLKMSPPRKGFFEDADFEAVCEYLPPWARPAVKALYWTGWRCKEILSLQWRQVDWKAQTLRLEPGSTKNEEGRMFPFGKLTPLRQLMENQRRLCDLYEREMGKVIVWVFFRPTNGLPIYDMRYQWRKACKKASVPGRLIHDLRRTAVRRMERAGVPRRVAMQLTGHLSEQVYQRYAIVNSEDLEYGIERIEMYRQTPHAQSTQS